MSKLIDSRRVVMSERFSALILLPEGGNLHLISVITSVILKVFKSMPSDEILSTFCKCSNCLYVPSLSLKHPILMTLLVGAVTVSLAKDLWCLEAHAQTSF